MILSDIKKDYLEARKVQDRATTSFWSFVIGEIENKTVTIEDGVKVYPDDKVIALLKSIKNKCLEVSNQEEADMLTKFIPEQLTADEISNIFISKPELTNMGECMKYLKENYPGLYDGKVASNIARNM